MTIADLPAGDEAVPEPASPATPPLSRLLVVDGHALFRAGMALLLAERFPGLPVAYAPNLTTALAQLVSAPDIDLLVLDLDLRDSQGPEALNTVRMAAPNVAVLVVSADARSDTIVAALEAGAAGYIVKTAKPGVIEGALRTVMAGSIYLPRQLFVSPEALPAGQDIDAPAPVDLQRQQAAVIWELGLTARQVDVLRLLVAGLSSKVIARQLCLAESSVKTHLIGLFRRLGVNSRVQAVIVSAQAGLHFNA